jgi:serine phosphatase RsbU (regulator of sigma subunit)
MNLRLRLVVAFFLLSVVPVAALTYYAYTNNVAALRKAARREAELLAGELSQRMQVVTGQLTERVGHLMELQNAQEAAAEQANVARAAVASETAQAATTSAAARDSVAETFGQVAMLLNNVQFQDFGRGRGRSGQSRFSGASGAGRGGRGTPPPGASAPPSPPSPPPAPTGIGSTPAAGSTTTADASRSGTPSPDAPGGNARRFRNFDRSGAPGAAPPDRAGAPPSSGGFPPPAADDADPNGITIDMRPIRQQIMQQYASQEDWAKLSQTERDRIIGEVNQRMLGVRMGIQMGTAEAQRRIAEAQRAAADKATEAAAAAAGGQAQPGRPASAASTGAVRQRSTLSGTRLDVSMEQNGEVIHAVNAEINLANLLSTVFSTTRRDSGEVPFAVAKDGRIFTPTDADRSKIQALGAPAQPGTPPGTTVVRDWVVVTTADPTGSGLKFGIARPVGDSLKDLQLAAVRNAALGMGFIALALVGIVPLSGQLTRNLSILSDGVNRIASGDYRARVTVRSQDEIGRLAHAFNQMAADVERHQRDAVEQERIKRELELGRQIQHDMLPHVPLRLGLTEIRGVSVPAREVGGDFFNYFQVAEGKVALLVGDVSGKGVGAALLMANIQASLRTRLALGQDLAALARELDTEIGLTTPGAVYATLFVAILDVAAHDLRYVNAGHHSQFVLRPDGRLERMPSTGMPVGLLAGHGYTERRVSVSPGDILFFYTDGCVEVENGTGDMFGTERLEALLKSAVSSGAEDVLAYVEAEIARFRGETEPMDDATMMAVRV